MAPLHGGECGDGAVAVELLVHSFGNGTSIACCVDLLGQSPLDVAFDDRIGAES